MNFTNAASGSNGKPREGLAAFGTAETAPDFSPVPPGIYTARVLQGEFTQTKAGADAYRMKFEVADGEHQGRTILRIWTLSEKAMPYVKRDLAVFGLNFSKKLLEPFPEAGKVYHVRLIVALQRGNDAIGWNDVKRIDLIRVDDSPIAEFLLPEVGEGEPK